MVSTKNRYNNPECDNSMTFQDCELAILRHAVDENEAILGEKIANSEDVKDIIKILENFLVRKKCICYGGTAINNILPKYAQFYNRDIEIPDYDFFSNNALDDALKTNLSLFKYTTDLIISHIIFLFESFIGKPLGNVKSLGCDILEC